MRIEYAKFTLKKNNASNIKNDDEKIVAIEEN